MTTANPPVGPDPSAPAAPRVIALGGASWTAPAHTLAALEAALAQGADGLAVETHLSADQHLVVAASDRLDRVAGAEGTIGQRTLRELKRLDAGRWFGRAFRGQRLQALGEVLERFQGRAELLVLLAGGSDFFPGIEDRVVDLLLLRTTAGGVTVGSADHHALRRCRALDPDLPLLALLGARPLDPAGLVPPAGASGLFTAVGVPASLLTASDVGAWRTAGMPCYAWAADDPARAPALAAWGVAALVTARPGEIRAALEASPRGDTR